MVKKVNKILLILTLLFLASCSNSAKTKNIVENESISTSELSTAIFAGGCFWCTESDFEKLPGVIKVESGYTNGFVENPKYKQVSSGTTGHIESVKVYYNSSDISYSELVDYLIKHVNPTDNQGQFVDRGEQYRPAIFYKTNREKQIADQIKTEFDNSGVYELPLSIEIIKETTFYKAEEYHQDYYKKNPLRYKYYRSNSGRDQYLEKTWKNKTFTSSLALNQAKYDIPSQNELKEILTPLQYKVTQKDSTERPFNNEYWNNTKSGIYVDIVSGEPLFSSIHKYKSGTGWPSFTEPLEKENVVLKEDNSLFTTRVEVRSKYANSHLGHVFTDGPKDGGGLRYCMNSAALKFIPSDELEEKGYSEYKYLFE